MKRRILLPLHIARIQQTRRRLLDGEQRVPPTRIQTVGIHSPVLGPVDTRRRRHVIIENGRPRHRPLVDTHPINPPTQRAPLRLDLFALIVILHIRLVTLILILIPPLLLLLLLLLPLQTHVTTRNRQRRPGRDTPPPTRHRLFRMQRIHLVRIRIRVCHVPHPIQAHLQFLLHRLELIQQRRVQEQPNPVWTTQRPALLQKHLASPILARLIVLLQYLPQRHRIRPRILPTPIRILGQLVQAPLGIQRVHRLEHKRQHPPRPTLIPRHRPIRFLEKVLVHALQLRLQLDEKRVLPVLVDHISARANDERANDERGNASEHAGGAVGRGAGNVNGNGTNTDGWASSSSSSSVSSATRHTFSIFFSFLYWMKRPCHSCGASRSSAVRYCANFIAGRDVGAVLVFDDPTGARADEETWWKRGGNGADEETWWKRGGNGADESFVEMPRLFHRTPSNCFTGVTTPNTSPDEYDARMQRATGNGQSNG